MHPNLLHLGRLTIPTFGLLAAIGLMLALALSLRTARLTGLDPDKLWNAGLVTIFAAFVLSRLLLIAIYLKAFLAYPILLLAVPSLTPLGLELTALVTLLYLRRRALPLRATLDAWAPCASLFWVFLAVGHLAEDSDPGLPSNLPWAFALPPDATRTQPVALYAALAAMFLTALLYRHLTRKHSPGHTAAVALAAIGLIQFFLTFFREPTATPFLLDPIQWLAIAMLLAAALLWLLPVPLCKEHTSHAL